MSGARPGMWGRSPGAVTPGDLGASKAGIGFIMTIIGGFIIVLGSFLLTFISLFLFGTPLPPWLMPIGAAAAIGMGVVFGLLVILSSILIYQPGYEMIGGILAIVFSILSLVVLGGVLFGTILGILGGLMAIMKK